MRIKLMNWLKPKKRNPKNQINLILTMHLQDHHSSQEDLAHTHPWLPHHLLHDSRRTSWICHQESSRTTRHSMHYASQEHDWQVHNLDKRHHQHQPQHSFDFVRLPSFSGSNDPTLYLEWKAKVEHLFNGRVFTTHLGFSHHSKWRDHHHHP